MSEDPSPAGAQLPSLIRSPGVQGRLLTAILVICAMIGFRSLFGTWAVALPIALGVLGAYGVNELAIKRRLLFGESLLVHVLGFIVLGALFTQGLRVDVFPAFARALINGWAALLSTPAPVDLTRAVTPVVFAVGWGGTLLGVGLHRISRIPALPIFGPLMAFAATTLFTVESRSIGWFQAAALIAGLVGLSLLQRRTDADRRETVVEAPALTSPRLLLGVGLVLLAAVAGPALAPSLPLFGSNDRFDLRDALENAWDPLDAPSPLATLKASIKEPRDTDLVFTVEGPEPVSRWTLAVMSSYSGVVWQVADPQAGPAEFIPVDTRLPATTDTVDLVADGLESALGDPVTHKITVASLGGHWLPHAGTATRVEFAAASTTETNPFDLRMNLGTGTLALPTPLSEGVQYELESIPNAALSEQELVDASFEVEDRSVELGLLPAPVTNLAADLIQGEDFGGGQINAIQRTLRGEGFYDKSEMTSPGHSYAEISDFIVDRGRIIGYEEHYAATAAVIARVARLPTRVVVGYLLEEDRWENQRAEVYAGDMSAWIEIDVEGRGWVPVDVTPDPSRQPTEEQLGQSSKNVAIPGDPPPPPPPPDSDLLDQEEPEEEEEEEDEDVEDDEVVEEGDGLFIRPAVLVSGVAGFLVLFPLMLGLIILAWKMGRRWRRRRASEPSRRIVGAWEELVDRLADAGYPAYGNKTTTEVVDTYAAAEDLDLPLELEDELRTLAKTVRAAAFSPQPPTSEDAKRAWELSDAAVQSSRSGVGLLERTRAGVSPASLNRNEPEGADHNMEPS